MFVSSIFNDFSRAPIESHFRRIFASLFQMHDSLWLHCSFLLFYVTSHFLLFVGSSATTVIVRSHKNRSISTWVDCVSTEERKGGRKRRHENRKFEIKVCRSELLWFRSPQRVAVVVDVTCLYRLSHCHRMCAQSNKLDEKRENVRASRCVCVLCMYWKWKWNPYLNNKRTDERPAHRN